MYENELKSLEERVSTFTKEEEIKAGTKKVQEVKKNLIILDQIKEGTEYYNRLLKKIEVALSWYPGKAPVRDTKSVSEVIGDMFGDKSVVYTKTIMFVSDTPLNDEMFNIPGCRNFKKDADKSRINYRVKNHPEIVSRDGDILVLHLARVPKAAVEVEEDEVEE
jgi:hypothetical protein